MATDLLVSHVPSTLEPVFVQITGTPIVRDGQRNPDFLTKQQKWNNTLSCWGIQRALLVAHDAQVNSPDNILKLADVILKESSDRPISFIEGDWLENWDWEDDLTDYIDAFYHHCEQGNYQFALDTLKAGDDLFNQPENHEKRLELYDYLSEILKN
jgi:hypothetical protein